MVITVLFLWRFSDFSLTGKKGRGHIKRIYTDVVMSVFAPVKWEDPKKTVLEVIEKVVGPREFESLTSTMSKLARSL